MNPYFQQVAGAPNFYAGTPIMPSQMMNLSGMPGMNGPMGMMMQMFMQPMIQQLSAQHGFIPLQFQPTQGAYDHMMANMIFRERMRAMQIASSQDQDTYYKFFRGMAHLTGTPFGTAQQQAARSMASDVAMIAPFIAQVAPEFLDNISGARGSNTVMSQFMSMGLRYARDPITGLTGPNGDTSGALATRVFQNLYGNNLSLGEVANRTRGMTAGRMGQLFDEMQRRGFMGAGVSESDRRGLSGTPAEIDTQLVNLNADRITNRLKDMSGAVTAMREIFGDMGHQGSMVELINGLQALTQGGMATMSGAKLESTVRNIQMLVKNSGMTMDGMLQLMAGGARVADRLGLDRNFVVSSSMGAAGFSAAFSQIGGGHLAGFGSLDRERVTQIDQQMRLNAAGSFQANVLNSVLALEASGMVRPGSAAAGLAEQIRSGTLKGPLTVEGYFEIMSRSGVSRDMALQSLHNRAGNQEFGAEAQTGNLVRKFQGQEFQSLLRGLYAPSASRALPAALRAALGEAGIANLEAGMGNIINMTPQQQQTHQTRMAATIDMMLAQLTPAQRAALGSDETSQRAALAPVAMTYLGNVSQAIATNPNLRHLHSLRGAIQLFNPETLQAGTQFQREQAINARLAGALAPFNLNPLSQRLVQSIISSRPDSNIGELLAEIMGGVRATPGLSPEKSNSLQGELGKLFSQDMHFDPETGALVPKGGSKFTFRQALERFRMDPSRQNERILAEHITRLMPGIQQAFAGAGLAPPEGEQGAPAGGAGGSSFAKFATGAINWLRGALRASPAGLLAGGTDGINLTNTVELKDVEIVLKDERNILNALATLVTRGSVRPPARGGK